MNVERQAIMLGNAVSSMFGQPTTPEWDAANEEEKQRALKQMAETIAINSPWVMPHLPDKMKSILRQSPNVRSVLDAMSRPETTDKATVDLAEQARTAFLRGREEPAKEEDTSLLNELAREGLRWTGAVAAAKIGLPLLFGVTGGLPMAAGIGLSYGLIRTAERKLGLDTQDNSTFAESLAELVTGKKVTLPEALRFPAEAAEATLFALGPKPLHKGVETLAKPFQEIGEKIYSNILAKPANIRLPFIGKSVAEMIQPGVERLPTSERAPLESAAKTMRRTQVMRSHMRDYGSWLSKEMEKLTPRERHDFLSAISGNPAATSPLATEAELRLNVYKLEPLFRDTMLKELGNFMKKPLAKGEQIGNVGQLLDTIAKPGANKDEIKAAMRKVIEDDLVSSDLKEYVRELYDLPAATVGEVADAAFETSISYLGTKLARTPGFISKTAKPGYVASKWEPFKGQFIPRDAELDLVGMGKIRKYAESWHNQWILSPWRAAKTVMRPAYHIRNWFNNVFFNDLGGLPFWRIDVYANAAKKILNKSPEWKKFQLATGSGETFSTDVLRDLATANKYGGGPFRQMWRMFSTVAKAGGNVQSASENYFKFAKYLHNVTERGMTNMEAINDALKWLINYSEITPEVAALRSTVMPFAVWYSKAIPLIAETAVKHPLRLGKWIVGIEFARAHALKSLNISDEEWDYIYERLLPDYIRQGIYLLLPWRDENGRLNMLNLTSILGGLGDVVDLMNQWGERVIPISHPILAAVEAIRNNRKWGGSQIWYEWDENNVKLMKALKYLAEQFLPALVPGGVDWNMLYKAFHEEPGALTPEAAVASAMGLKIVQPDLAELIHRKQAVEKIHLSEAKRNMQKELRKAKSQDEINEIIDYYSRALGRIAAGE